MDIITAGVGMVGPIIRVRRIPEAGTRAGGIPAVGIEPAHIHSLPLACGVFNCSDPNCGVCAVNLKSMKLPLHTASAPLVGKEARRVLKAVSAGRAISNSRARAFAAEIVEELRGASAKHRKSPVVRNG